MDEHAAAGIHGRARRPPTPRVAGSARSSGSSAASCDPAGVLRYRAEIADLVENELDHLLVTTVSDDPRPDPEEVVEWRFIAPDELDAWISLRREDFTAWFPPAWEVLER